MDSGRQHLMHPLNALQDVHICTLGPFKLTSDALGRDETVALPGFGTFSTKTRAARQGRDPRTLLWTWVRLADG